MTGYYNLPCAPVIIVRSEFSNVVVVVIVVVVVVLLLLLLLFGCESFTF